MSNLTFRSLASSSAGNAYLIADGETTLLLECGLTIPRLKKATGFALSTVAACFITHEHDDHSHAAAQLIRQGIPVYMSEGTARELALADAQIVEHGKCVQIGALRVMPFRVWHDAAEPVGYLIEDSKTHERLLFAADTRNLDWIIPRLTYVVIECNYDERTLGSSQRIHDKLRERIRCTHFEMRDVVRYLHKLDLSGCIRIYLIHLSDRHSNERMVLQTFSRDFPGIEITVCPK